MGTQRPPDHTGRVRRGGPRLRDQTVLAFVGPGGGPRLMSAWPQEFPERGPVGKRSVAVRRGLGPELEASAHSEARVAQRERVVRQSARRFSGAGYPPQSQCCWARCTRGVVWEGGPASGGSTRAPAAPTPQQLALLALSRPTPQKGGAAVQSPACTDTPSGSPSTRPLGPCLRRIGVWLTGGVVAGRGQTSTGRFCRSPAHGPTPPDCRAIPRLRAG